MINAGTLRVKGDNIQKFSPVHSLPYNQYHSFIYPITFYSYSVILSHVWSKLWFAL